MKNEGFENFKAVRKVSRKLAKAGVQARVCYSQGMILIHPSSDAAAREAMGFDSFTGYLGKLPVVIFGK